MRFGVDVEQIQTLKMFKEKRKVKKNSLISVSCLN